MNTKIALASIASLIGLASFTTPVSAGSNERAAIGGFIGGVIVGSILNDNDHRGAVTVRHYESPRGYDRHDCRPDGYWTTRSVRVWVPGCWVETRGRHGRCEKTFRPGYYTYRTERVWVAVDARHHR